MTYLLDTNVLSEVRKRRPHPGVTEWFSGVAAKELFLSALVVGEIRQGVERLRKRDRAQAGILERWLATLKRDFEQRILPVSVAIGEAWGRLNAQTPLPTVDGLLAATALVHGLTLVTRDTSMVDATGVPLLNPWA